VLILRCDGVDSACPKDPLGSDKQDLAFRDWCFGLLRPHLE
jgi:hypothetical protein